MSFEAVLANMQDLERIQRLADAGYFALWFPEYSRRAAMRYVAHVTALAMVYRIFPYPGPVVTE